jgi:enamine deaminase RidA (YjgF/YER057c/UK114 family)
MIDGGGGAMTVERRTLPELAPPPGYSHLAVATGRRLVFLAGQVPLDRDGNLVGPNDAGRQAGKVLENLLVSLEAAGAGPDDVVKTTVYVAGVDHDEQILVWEAVQRSPIASAPSTLLGVALLGYRGQLVEIEAVAVTE